MSHELSQYLSAASSRGPIVLIIDALDQLSDTYDGSAPLRLPCLPLLESFS